nr:nucleotide-binding alpha-beta plait domain-containing protein [Tanacetum cinerariifolium]
MQSVASVSSNSSLLAIFFVAFECASDPLLESFVDGYAGSVAVGVIAAGVCSRISCGGVVAGSDAGRPKSAQRDGFKAASRRCPHTFNLINITDENLAYHRHRQPIVESTGRIQNKRGEMGLRYKNINMGLRCRLGEIGMGAGRMGDRRSKEDYVHQISTSIYVTNFPEQFSFRDLWKKCQEYGRVIDVYIPNRGTKSGDRFGFVRFIHIKDVDRLVKNLCTLWMGCLRLHANVARFQRPPLNKAQHVKGAIVGQKSFGASSNSKVFSVSQSSYAGAVKNDGEHKQVAEMDSKPSLVIDESCMLEYDYSLALKGNVADFGLLTNLKTVLTKEDFERFNLKYLRGFWVLIEFCTKELLEKFKSHVGVGSWFSSLDKRICIKTKMEQNIFETIIIIIKGKVFWIHAKEVSGWIPDFLDEEEEDEEEDESDEDFEMVPDTIFSPILEEPKHDNKSNFEEGEIQSEDPVHIYNLLVKKPKNDNKEEESSKATLKYPPGFTPNDVLRTKDVQDVDDVVEVQENTQKSNKQDNFTKDNNVRDVTHSKEEDKESFCLGQFKRSVGLQTGGSILQVMEDLVKVGQTMGYKIEGCVSNIEEIIKTRRENESYQ